MPRPASGLTLRRRPPHPRPPFQMHTLRYVLTFLLLLAAPVLAQEYIVVSGGPALRKWEDYRVPEEQHDRYAGNFIKAAHIRL